ncbi:97c0a9ca-cf2c-4eea-a099-d67ea875c685-CDS [Sclerotinia trifoliorum]|uniref:97c0a9ca-cf2c-4eea-a099-d67ea875c685-CDS n=1 Tax=Sclerotinia trifoliorum TaxID=28548 RepID=A0A8H2ZRV0_9HELO|nr:97c0a9ca-cf2c-4eea-a099-d67ea875c685-CDS [Sclerotinia trifoliorum]
MSSICEKDQNLSDNTDNHTNDDVSPLTKMETLLVSENPTSPNVQPSQEISKNEEVDLQLTDLCAICTERMDASEEFTKMEPCCQNLFHNECLRKWINSTIEMEQLETCPLCRHVLSDLFIDLVFDGDEEESVPEPRRCCERDDMEMIIAAKYFENLPAEQRKALYDLFEKIEEEFFGISLWSEGERNRLRVIFFLCKNDPLGNVIQMPGDSIEIAHWRRLMALLNRALLQMRNEEQESVLCSTIFLRPRPYNFDFFHPDVSGVGAGFIIDSDYDPDNPRWGVFPNEHVHQS